MEQSNQNIFWVLWFNPKFPTNHTSKQALKDATNANTDTKTPQNCKEDEHQLKSFSGPFDSTLGSQQITETSIHN